MVAAGQPRRLETAGSGASDWSRTVAASDSARDSQLVDMEALAAALQG
jgi:hypothetical protein